MVLRVQGEFAPELVAFDGMMRDLTGSAGAQGVSLAIARNGKLLFAQSISRDDSGDPVLLQNSPSRYGSCSKLITKIAIYQLIERGAKAPNGKPITFDTLASAILTELPTPAVTLPIVSTSWYSASLIDLIRMNNTISPDFAGLDANVAAAFAGQLPITNKQQIIRYVIAQSDQPKTYSNSSYLILCAIIEAVSGLDYVDYVKKKILSPLGLIRPEVAGSTLSGRAPYEAYYHADDTSLQPSVMDPAQPLVPNGEGNINLAVGVGVGGWLLTAADFTKILSAFAVPWPGPLFTDKAFVEQMFAPGPYQWTYATRHGDLSFEWGGVLPGLRSVASYRTDGIVMTYYMNRDEDTLTPSSAWQTFIDGLHAQVDATTDWPSPDFDLFESLAIPAFSAGAGWGASGAYVAQEGSGWHGWYPLGGRLMGGPSASVVAPGFYDVYSIGEGGRLWQKWWDGRQWQPGVADWTLHDDGSARFKGAPNATSLTTASRDAYLVGAQGNVVRKFWDGAWHGPFDLGGVVGGEAHVGVLAIQNLRDLYVRGQDGALYQKWWDSSGSWHPGPTSWARHSEPFVLLSAPAVVGNAVMRDVYAVGPDKAVWHKSWRNSAWGPWTSIGAPTANGAQGAPGVVMVHPGFIDVYVRGADDRLYQKWWDGAKWTPSDQGWVLHDDGGFRLTSSPTVISESDHHRGVFGRGSDGCMYYKFWLR